MLHLSPYANMFERFYSFLYIGTVVSCGALLVVSFLAVEGATAQTATAQTDTYDG